MDFSYIEMLRNYVIFNLYMERLLTLNTIIVPSLRCSARVYSYEYM